MAVTRSTLAERAQYPHHPMEARGRAVGACSFTADLGPDSCRGEPHGGSEDGPNRWLG